MILVSNPSRAVTVKERGLITDGGMRWVPEKGVQPGGILELHHPMQMCQVSVTRARMRIRIAALQRTLLWGLVFLLCPGSLSIASGIEAEAVLRSMEEGYQRLHDYEAMLMRTERFQSEIVEETMLLRFRKPFDVYLKWIGEPFAGRQVSYRKDRNPSEFYLRAESWLKRLLAPERLGILSPRALRNQHHLISDIGIGKLIRVILGELNKGQQDPSFRLSRREDDTVQKRAVWVIRGTFPNQQSRSYAVAPGDTIWSIAEKFDIDPYVIVHNNDNVADFFDLEAGKELRIPRYHGYRVETAVDKEWRLPLRIEIFDWSHRLYEAYTYTNMRCNPGFGDEDFSLK